jgi:chromosome segregation ATPase
VLEKKMDLSGLKELANAPFLGLMLVIVILLIFLAGLAVRQMVSLAVNTSSSQSKLIADLQQQIGSLSGQLEEMRKVATAANERGIRSALRIEMLREDLKETLADLEGARQDRTRLAAERDEAAARAERFEQQYQNQEGQIRVLRMHLGKLMKRVKQLEGALEERGIALPPDVSTDMESSADSEAWNRLTAETT